MAQPVGWHPARLQNSINYHFLELMFWFSGFPWLSGLSIKAQNSKVLIAKLFKDWGEMEKGKYLRLKSTEKISEIREEAPSCFAAALLAFRVLHPVQPGFRCQNFYAGSGWKTNRNQVFGAAWCAPTHTVPAFTCLQNIGSTLHCRESTLTSVESFQQKMMTKISLIGSPAFLRKL